MSEKLRAAAEMALAAMLNFENVVVGRTSFHKLTGDDVFCVEINALHQALAEPPNSTTDVVEREKEIYHLWRESESYQVPMTEEGEKLAEHRYHGFKKGYMARREWQGLTYEEKSVIRSSVAYSQFMTAGEYAEKVQDATDVKLKEKNHG